MNNSICDYDNTEVLDPIIKTKIISFFVHCRCDEIYVSSMSMVDKFTGQNVERYIMAGRPVPRMTFVKSPYEWKSEDVYHFDVYNSKLNPEFKEYALNYTKRDDEKGESLTELYEKLAKKRLQIQQYDETVIREQYENVLSVEPIESYDHTYYVRFSDRVIKVYLSDDHTFREEDW